MDISTQLDADVTGVYLDELRLTPGKLENIKMAIASKLGVSARAFYKIDDAGNHVIELWNRCKETRQRFIDEIISLQNA